MTCYTTDYHGTLAAGREIAEFSWLTYADRNRVTSVDRHIFWQLHHAGQLTRLQQLIQQAGADDAESTRPIIVAAFVASVLPLPAVRVPSLASLAAGPRRLSDMTGDTKGRCCECCRTLE